MIVYRFMSNDEYLTLMSGKVLINNTDHRKKYRCRTSSHGFCFFTEDPDEAVHWLSGIVNLEQCVTLEVPDNYLVKSWGLYSDGSKVDKSKPVDLSKPEPTMKKDEYWRCRYSLEDVKILEATDKYYKMYPPRHVHKRLLKAALALGYI